MRFRTWLRTWLAVALVAFGVLQGCSAQELTATEQEIADVASIAVGALPGGTYSAQVGGTKVSWTKGK